MKRIGIAASKIARGNLLVYHAYVLLISFSVSLFVFIVSASTVMVSLVLIWYLGKELNFFTAGNQWRLVFGICMGLLTILMVIFNLVAVLVNIRIRRKKRNGI